MTSSNCSNARWKKQLNPTRNETSALKPISATKHDEKRANIDEEPWESLNSTTSRPFDRPETGKIAVKVINHFGDDVLKVYEV